MALKDQVVELVLRARNLLSGDTEKAAQSVESLTGSAEDLQSQLRTLEDQAGLIKQFDAASKAVDRTGAAYDRAQVRLDKLKSKLGDTGPLTEAQQREFTAASRAVDRASVAYEDAQGSLKTLSSAADKAGIDVTNLSEAKRENAKQATAAKRAIEDYNQELAQGDGRIKQLGKSLLTGAAALAKWATAAAAAGAALAATAITRLTTTQADLARQTLASAEAFGVSAVALQKWQYAAEQVGIGGEKTAEILKDVSEKIGDAFATGGGEAAEVIDRLNLSVEDLVRLSPDQQILKISEQLTGMPKAEQIQVLESLASDASLLLPLLDNNAQKLRELAAVAEQRGDILTEEELQRLAAFDAAFERMKTSISGVFKQIAVNLSPAFQKLAERIDRAIGSQPELIEKISAKLAALVGRVTKLATEWANSTGSMEQSFRPLVSTLEGTRQLFLVLVSAVQVVGATIAEVAARANYDWKNLSVGVSEALNAIGLGSDEAVLKARLLRDVAAESVRELDEQADQYVEKMKSAASAAASAFSDARTSASQAATGFSNVSEAAVAAVEDAGQKTKDAAAAAAEAIARIAGQANKALAGALDTLQVDLEEVKTGITGVEQEAIVAFATTASAIQQTGATAQEQSQVITAAFKAAFDQIESDASREQLKAAFKAAADAGIVSAEEYKAALADVAGEADDTAGSIKGLGQEIEGLGSRMEARKLISELTTQLDSGKISAEEYGEALREINTRMAELSVMEAWEGIDRAAESTGKAADEAGRLADELDRAGDSASGAAEKTEQAAQEFTGTVINNFNQAGQAAGGLESRLASVTARMEQIETTGTGLNRWQQALNTMTQGALKSEAAFLRSAIGARNMAQAIGEGVRTTEIFRVAAVGAGRAFSNLGAEQLSGLRSALSGVRRELDDLNASLKGTIQNTQDEIDRMNGVVIDQEKRLYESKMEELEAALATAKQARNQEMIDNAEEAIRLTKEARRLRIQQQREEEKAARDAERAAAAADQETASQNNSVSARLPASGAAMARRQAVTPQAVRTVALQFQNPQGAPLGGVQAIDDQTVDQVIAALERAGLVVARGA